MMKKLKFGIVGFIIILVLNCTIYGANDSNNKPPQMAGEFFGVPVPIENYYFAKRAVLTFNATWRNIPQNAQELEDMVWQELLFSYEAYRRGIVVKPEEIDQEIENMLKAEKADFRWRVDKEKYQNWAKEKLQMSIDTFRNYLEHLIKLDKLRKQVIESIQPTATEEEAYNKFLDEYNSLSVELVQFDDLKEAQKFFEQASQPIADKDWEELIWQDLVFSIEALQRKIELTTEEIAKARETFYREQSINFNWRNEPEKLKAWTQEKFGVSEESLEKFIIYFAKIDRLQQKIFNKEELEIDQAKGYDNFKAENAPLVSAYLKFLQDKVLPADDILRFSSLEEAKNFYQKIDRRPGFWADRRRQDPKSFKRPGFVALDFLINMWGFKREDAYKMMDKTAGVFYPPAPIYKGYGVFKILESKKADTSLYAKQKEAYFAKIKSMKKYEGFIEWAKKFKEHAGIKVYIK